MHPVNVVTESINIFILLEEPSHESYLSGLPETKKNYNRFIPVIKKIWLYCLINKNGVLLFLNQFLQDFTKLWVFAVVVLYGC